MIALQNHAQRGGSQYTTSSQSFKGSRCEEHVSGREILTLSHSHGALSGEWYTRRQDDLSNSSFPSNLH